MKTIYTTSFLLILASCGEQAKNSSSSVDSVATTTAEQDTSFAKLVKDKSELECTKKNYAQIIYSTEEKIFYTCDENKEWIEIEMPTVADGKNGKDGADGKDGIGTDGKNGTDGKDGLNGKDGANGKDGSNGKDGTDGGKGDTGFAQTRWTDPVTGLRWISLGWAQIMPTIRPCITKDNIKGWMMPTEAQARAAVDHGLMSLQGTPDIIFIAPFATAHYYYLDTNDMTKYEEQTQTIAAMLGIYCVYNP